MTRATTAIKKKIWVRAVSVGLARLGTPLFAAMILLSGINACGPRVSNGFPSGASIDFSPSAPKCASQWPGSSHRSSTIKPLTGVRPQYEYSLMSARYPLVVHAMSSTKTEYATRILSYAEKSWEVIVEQMGFRAPRPDTEADGGAGTDSRIDIYIRDDLATGVGGYTGFSGFYDSTPESDAVGYLVIADLLTDVYIRGVVAHEFFHLSQMAYDWFEHPGFMEATAVWVTDHVFDDENFYSRYYAYYNKSPSLGLDHISFADPYQYGAGMWFQYFDEKYGHGDGTGVRQLWEGTVQTSMDNEPDYFDVMRTVAGGAENLNEAFTDFGSSRLLVGSRADGHHLREAETWSERVIPTFIELGDAARDVSITWSVPSGMQAYSHAFLRVTNVFAGAKLKIELDSASEKVAVNEVKASPTERVIILSRLFDGDYDPELSVKDTKPVFGNLRFVADNHVAFGWSDKRPRQRK